MILSTLFFGCAVALAAGQSLPSPQLRTEAGKLILVSSEDVLIEIHANGNASEPSTVALLESIRNMSAHISTLREELSTSPTASDSAILQQVARVTRGTSVLACMSMCGASLPPFRRFVEGGRRKLPLTSILC